VHPERLGTRLPPPEIFATTADHAHQPYAGGANPAAEAAAPTIPGYEVLGELGRGGMGVVYQGRQVALNRVVALKMILVGGHAGEQDLARFRTEAEAVARLQHPNIVQIYEVGKHQGLSYFSLEFCAGGSLAARLDGTPWTPRQAAALVETLSRAVHAAHQQHIVHRDLKPANVLLARGGCQAPDGGEQSGRSRPPLAGFTPKITDFGLAKKLDEVGQTQPEAILGTPSYMAPEQAGRSFTNSLNRDPKGSADRISAATDVYALGAILYELVTGRPPFRAATPLDTVLQVISDDPVPPRQLQPRTPHDLETICLKCLQKEPPRRYASALDLADDLRCFLAGEPILARPTRPWERAWKWARRRPAGAALIVFGVVTVLALLGASAWFAGYEQDQRLHAEDLTRQADASRRQATEKADAEARARRRGELLAARLALGQAEARFEHLEFDRGLLLLARGLQIAPDDAAGLRRVLRTNLAARSLYPPRMILPHDHRVNAAGFGQGGRTVWTVTADQLFHQWDAATGKLLGERCFGARFPIRAVSPDGATVLTGSPVRPCNFWEAATGKRLGKPLPWQAAPYQAVFSPDGTVVATASEDNLRKHEVRLWNVRTRQPVGQSMPHPGSVSALAFSPDGKHLLAANEIRDPGPEGKSEVRLWDATTGQPMGDPVPHPEPVAAIAFSPDGNTFATARGGTVQLWNTATRTKGGALPEGGLGLVKALAFDPGGQSLLVSTAGDAERHDSDVDPETQKAQVWRLELAGGQVLGGGFWHRAPITTLAFSPDGKAVLTCANDQAAWRQDGGLVRLWDASGPAPGGWEFAHGEEAWGPVFSPNGRVLLAQGKLWEVATGKRLGRSVPIQEQVFRVLSPDGKFLLTGQDKEGACLWDVATGRQVGLPLAHRGDNLGAAFSADGKLVVTAAGDIRLWDTATGEPVGRPLRQDGGLAFLALSPDCKRVLTAELRDRARLARLWDAANGQPTGTILAHAGALAASAFSPDGKSILTGSLKGEDHGEARLWEAATGKPLGPPLSFRHPVVSVAFSPDGTTFLTCAGWKAEGEVRLWDTATVRPLGPPLPHQGVTLAAFSPDGRTVLTASLVESNARVWDVATGQPIGGPIEHLLAVLAVTFDRDGRTALTAGKDGVVRLRPVPRPLQGSLERFTLLAEVMTGKELDPDDAVRDLDVRTLLQRFRRLQALGGLPRP
jgi:WD40 repeat protein/serine/threonine protein kinase